MNWIKWKFIQLKQCFINIVLYRAFWKKLLNSESDNANWEIWHNSDKKTVTLHYVPQNDYSEKDVKIEVPYEQFEDLVKFMIRIR
jgi:hypothetical protein